MSVVHTALFPMPRGYTDCHKATLVVKLRYRAGCGHEVCRDCLKETWRKGGVDICSDCRKTAGTGDMQSPAGSLVDLYGSYSTFAKIFKWRKSDDDEVAKDKEAWVPKAYYPASVLLPDGHRPGASFKHPISEDILDKFHFNEPVPSGMKHRIRTATAVAFVDEGGNYVSVSRGYPSKPTYMIAVTGPATGKGETGQSLQTGSWIPSGLKAKLWVVEKIYVKVPVKKVEVRSYYGFAGGENGHVWVTGNIGVYAIQGINTRYTSYWAESIKSFRGDQPLITIDLEAPLPDWMLQNMFNDLKRDPDERVKELEKRLLEAKALCRD
ncbi:hypothetical protein FRC07_007165 [Ceratobasidium sp. 392]|nr:hypothetical protein FRC07_007165 [Ceratobasidium sp. 392]